MNKSFISFRFFLVFLFFVPLLSGCAAIPVSDEELSTLGADVNRNMIAEYGEYRDGKVKTYVEGIGKRVEATSDYAGKPLEFTVLDTQIVNAFSVPGGYIHVTRGLLTRVNSESELAFVLGHEIGHLTARHAASRISQLQTSNVFSQFLGLFISMYSNDVQLGNLVAGIVDFSSALVILSYGRDAEFQADNLGLKYAYDSRYNPETASNFLETLEKIEKSKVQRSALSDLLSTHPPTEDRVARSSVYAKTIVASLEHGAAGLEVGRPDYIGRLDGIVLGDSLDSGFITKEAYYNKKFMLTLKKPDGWNIAAARSYLAGLYTDKNNIFLVFAKIPSTEVSLEEYGRQFFLENLSDKTFTPQFTQTTYASLPALYSFVKKDRNIKALFFKKGQIFYTLVYSYNIGMFTDYDKVFQELASKFSFMDEKTAAGIQEDKLKLYIAAKGDTYEGLAMKFYGAGRFRQLLIDYNGASGELLSGSKVKVPPGKYLEE